MLSTIFIIADILTSMDALTVTDIGLRLGAAVGFGALVGLERERKHRPAGFRTMILISLGCAGFVLVGIEAIAVLPAQFGAPPSAGQTVSSGGMPVAIGQAELSRVLQGILGGIGFLGAGAVIQNKKAVRGLTTAAAVWVTAAIGAACGLALYKLAGMIAFGTLFTLIVLEWFEERYFPDPGEDDHDRKNGKDEIRIVLDRDGRPLAPKE